MNFEEALKYFKMGTHYKDASLDNGKKLPKKLVDFAYSWLNRPDLAPKNIPLGL